MSAPSRTEAVYLPLDRLLAAGARHLRTARLRSALGTGLLLSSAWALVGALAGRGLGVPGAPWVLVIPPVLAAIAALLRRGPRPAETAEALRPPSAALRSAIRSTVELRGAGGEGSPSPSLVAAHAQDTAGHLAGLDVVRLLPRAGSARLLALGLAAVLLDALLAALGPPRLAANFRALRGGVARPAGAAEQEPITGDIALTYLYPAHTRLAPRTVAGTDGSIEAPAGTEVRLRTRADRDVAGAAAVVNGVPVPLTVHDRRDLAGSLLCRTAGSYFFRFLDGRGRVLAEGPPIPIALQADAPPQVAIERPGSQLEVDPRSRVIIDYRADDDYGLSEIALLYRAPGAAKDARVVLRRTPESPRHLSGEATFDLTPLGLAPGDKVSYTIEALDDDAVAGPKSGRARTQTLSIFSAAEHHEEALREAHAVWEKLLSLLADRIDERTAPALTAPTSAGEAADRRALELCGEMEGLSRKLRKDRLTPPALWAALANVARGERARASATLDARELGSEGWHAVLRSGRAARPLEAALGAEVEGLERDVLYLEALLDRQTAEDLVSLSHELASRRRQLAALLEKYRSAPTPDLRAAIDAQLARLHERMAQLFARMAELTKSLPDEHLNAPAAAALAQKDHMSRGLDAIRQKLAQGDVDGALAALDQLGGALDGVEQRFRRSAGEAGQQYPGLARKVSALQRDLHALGEGQRRIASETSALRQRYRQALAQRAPVTPQAIARLKAKVAAARAALAKVPEDALPPGGLLGGAGEDPLAETKESVERLGRALDSRDLDEALRMADRAAVGAHAVSEGLARQEAIAKAYAGDLDGPRAAQLYEDARRQSEAAVPPLEQVHDELSKLFPPEDSVLSGADKRHLGELSQEQSRLRRELGKVQNDLEGVQKTAPIFGPSASQKLEQAGGEMAGAQDALGAHEPGRAARHEQGALEQLDGFEQAMKKGGGSGSGGGLPLPLASGDESGGDEESGQGWSEEHEKVAIPGADQYQVPPEFRRDILDAMKQKAPPQYEDQVKRYYQEIVK